MLVILRADRWSRPGGSHGALRRRTHSVDPRLITMPTYLVRRSAVARRAHELDAALTRLRAFEESPPPGPPVRWLRSYALREADGGFGLLCALEAGSVDAVHRHAEFTRVRADEIVALAATHVARAFAPTMVYLVRRRSVWTDLAAFYHSCSEIGRVADREMALQLSWLRSDAVRENDGTLGATCLFQAVDPAALVEHAGRVGLRADDVVPVIGRIVVHDDDRERAGASLAEGF
jgi:hypothetical protein